MTVDDVVKNFNRRALRTVLTQANAFSVQMYDIEEWCGALCRLAAEAAYVDLLIGTAEEDCQKANNLNSASPYPLDTRGESDCPGTETCDNLDTPAQKQF